MRSEFIITSVNHYDMGENRGLSVRVVGKKKQTNNAFGLDISQATVSDYSELSYLQRFAKRLPAKFKADFEIVTVKGANGKEMSGVALSELEFVNSMEFVDVKETVAAK